MSDADLTSPTLDSDLEHDYEVLSDSASVQDVQAGETDNASLTVDNEIHEDDMHEQDVAEPQPSDAALDTEVEHAADAEPAAAEGASPDALQEAVAVAVATPIRQQTKSAKSPLSTKSPAGKSAKSPVPVVKKVINSGTFGTGAIKPSPPVAAKAGSTSPSKRSSAPSVLLRKATSAAGSTVSKDSRPSATTTKSSASKASTASTAKGTMFTVRTNTTSTPSTPPRPTPSRKPSLPLKPSMGLNAERKPSPEPTRAGSRTGPSPLNPASPRPSTPTAGNRPRAQVSDGVPSRRASLGPKPTPPISAKPTINRRATGTPSISSLKDIVEDTSIVEDLQKKLASERSLVEARSEELASLQRDLKDALDRLEQVSADNVSKQVSIDELQEGRQHIEEQHAMQQSAVEKLRIELEQAEAELANIRTQLDATRADAVTKTEQVVFLEEQVSDREKKWDETKYELERLRVEFDESASIAATSAAAGHEALNKARAEYDAIKKEIETLNAAHESAKVQLGEKSEEFRTAQAHADELSAQVEELRLEKTENATRLSELEVEILELKEAAEKAEDDKHKSLTRIKALEEQLAKAAADSEQTIAEAKRAAEEHERALADVRYQHDATLRAANSAQDKLVEKLKKLEDELTNAIKRHEEALSHAASTEDAHAAKVSELEKFHEERANELTAETKRFADELANQEAQYVAKVDEIKAEHGHLLQEAFEKAKAEAGNAYAQDLQALRTQSRAMIEDVNTAHKVYIENLKAEHNSTLDTKTKALEKTISNQLLELKATHDDLSKAKAAVATSTSEIEKLREQLEESEKTAAAVAESSASSQSAEVVRLTSELSSAHDEGAALKEVLNAQKDSMSELSSNHSLELEAAAKARAEGVTNLRHEFEQVIGSLHKDRAALSTRVSDLEGELASLQATIAAQADAPAAPKGNGSTSAVVSREELQRLHDAHNLKMRDLEAQHDISVKGLHGNLTSAFARAEELEAEVDRRSMEIKYLESDVEEKDDLITRLKEDIAHLSDELEKCKSGLHT